MKTIHMIVGLWMCIVCIGCDQLRFAPGEAMKANAWAHYRTTQLAADAAKEQNASGELCGLTELSARQSTAFVGDYGMPKELPAVETPQQALSDANQQLATAAMDEASQRPDPWQTADVLLQAALTAAGVIGGVSGRGSRGPCKRPATPTKRCARLSGAMRSSSGTIARRPRPSSRHNRVNRRRRKRSCGCEGRKGRELPSTGSRKKPGLGGCHPSRDSMGSQLRRTHPTFGIGRKKVPDTFFCSGRRQVDEEDRADAGGGFEADLAIHAAEKAFDDGQAKSFAAGAVDGIELVEHLEDLLLVFGGDADAVVGDGIDAMNALDAAVDADREGPIGTAVFNGIVDQVREDLGQLSGVGKALGQRLDGHLGGGVVELKPGALENAVDQFVHGNWADLQRFAADAADFQQALLQGVQLADAGGDVFEGRRDFPAEQFLELPMVGFGPRIAGQELADLAAGLAQFAAEALDVDQGRAEVVGADIDDAFEFVGLGLEVLEQLLALLLGQNSGGHVRHKTLQRLQIALSIVHAGSLFPHPLDRTIGSANPIGDLIRLIFRQGLLGGVPDHLPIFRYDDVVVGQFGVTTQVRGRISGQGHATVADELHRPIAVVPAAIGDPRQIAHQRRQSSPAFVKLVLGAFAFGDIRDHRQRNLFSVDLHGVHGKQGGNDLLVLASKMNFVQVDDAFFLENSQHSRTVFGVGPDPQFGGAVPDRFVAGKAHDPFKTFIDIQQHAVRDPRQGSHFGAQAEHFGKFFSADAQFFLGLFAGGDDFGVDDDSADGTVGLVPRSTFPAGPVGRAVLADIGVILGAAHLAGQRPLVDISPFPGQVGKDLVVVFTDDILFLDLVIVQIALAHIDIPQVPVMHGDGASIVLDDIAHQIVGVGQRLLGVLLFGDILGGAAEKGGTALGIVFDPQFFMDDLDRSVGEDDAVIGAVGQAGLDLAAEFGAVVGVDSGE